MTSDSPAGDRYQQIWARYLPDLVLRRLGREPRFAAEPFDASFEAAVLFADISGFTALTERLCAAGTDGVEELTGILNAYFGRIIEVIHAHGGDVVKFAGDALLAFWQTDGDESLPYKTRRCVQGALAVQASLADASFRAPAGVKLGLRVSVSAGRLRQLSLGGAMDRWEFVVAGEPLAEAGGANDLAAQGEVVLSPSAFERCAGAVEGELIREGCFRAAGLAAPFPPEPAPSLVIPAGESGRVRSFVPASIRPRISAGQEDWLAELRRLSILFVSLPDLAPGVLLEHAQTAMLAIQDVIYHYEGSVNKLSVDDKGVSLVAAFGMPPYAHDDDPERGVRAALELRKRLEGLGWRYAFGLTTGRTYCGSIGNDRRCEYTLIGDVVNLAARLMQAAKGGILCDKATREASSRIAFDALEPLKLKGKKAPIPAFRPRGDSRLSRRSFAATRGLVGRSQERLTLARVLQEPGDDARLIAPLILGPAGTGKSSLQSDLLAKAAELGARVILGLGDSAESRTPYYAWRRVVQRLLSSSPRSLDAAEWSAVLEERLREAGAEVELAPLLNSFLPIAIPDNALTRTLVDEPRALRTAELVLDLLTRACQDSALTILAFDDCQWLDSASWTLLTAILRARPKLTIVLAARSLDDAPPEAQAILESPRLLRVEIGNLPREDLARLLREHLQVEEIEAGIIDPIFERSDGNPLFSVQLASALCEDGAIKVEDRRLRLTRGRLVVSELPDSIHGAVTGRLDRLTLRQQLLIKVASVIGKSFEARLLCEVYPIEEQQEAILDELRSLVELGLVAADSLGEAPSFRFVLAVTRDVAYKLMPAARRRDLHGEIARRLEDQYGEGAFMNAALADHWARAGVPECAVPYAIAAAEDALRIYANRESIEFLAQALALAPEDPRRGRWLCLQGEAYYRTGDLEAALDCFRRGLEPLGYPMPEGGALSIAAATAGALLVQTGHRLAPRLFVGRCGGERETYLEAARAYERLAQIHYLNNRKAPTLQAAFFALNLAERAGPSPELARSYANAAVGNGLLMLHGVARAHTRRAKAIVEAIDNPDCSTYVDMVNALYWTTAGRWDEGLPIYERSLRLAKEMGDQRRFEEICLGYMLALHRRARLAESEAVSARLLELATASAADQAAVWGAGNCLYVLALIDPSDPAIPGLQERLRALLEGRGKMTRADRIYGFAHLCNTHRLRGEEERARACADAAHRLFEDSPQVAAPLLECYGALLELALDNPKDKRQDKRARRILAILGEYALMYPVAKTRRRYYKGKVHAAAGQRWRARRCFRAAAEAARALAMHLDEARALEELAALAPARAEALRERAARLRERSREADRAPQSDRSEAEA